MQPLTVDHSPAPHTFDLPVLGMTCAACVGRVEKAVAAVPGVERTDVNLALSRARVVFARGSAAPGAPQLERAVIDAIQHAGYEVPADVLDKSRSGGAKLAAIEAAVREDTAALRRDAVLAIGLTIPLLVIAMSHGRLPLDATSSTIAQLVLGTLVVLGPGRRYFTAGFAAVRHKSPDMNTLVALGAGAAWASSTVAVVRWFMLPPAARHHAPMVYFEAGAAIVAFVMIGKMLEARARSRLADAVRGLISLAPVIAHEMRDGAPIDVDAATLAAGTQVLVRPGERVPADGTIVEGTSALDESLLTGEALPVDKTQGAPVYAGTLNYHGALTIRVARAGDDTALARIARAVEDAQGNKAPISRLADRVASVFVPIVLAIAALTFVVWFAAGVDTNIALERTIAVLVIACPCALGLATPAAVAVGTARGAELGILFRSGGALERGSEIDVVAFDKTGTLTANAPMVTKVHAADPTHLLRLAASAEQASEHPIARALVAAAKERTIALVAPTDVVAEPGRGVTATVDGQRVRVGSRDAVALAGASPTALDDELPAGATICYVMIDGVLAGFIAISDPPTPAARSTIAALRALAISPVMITGDREEAAHVIAQHVGIDRIHAGVAPTGKATIVAALREGKHRVAMVGDGINDAPALAAADLGIALASGTDIAAAAADVTLLRGGVANVPTALRLARATLRTIRANLIAAFAYNAICIPVAAGVLYPFTGWQLSPVLASAAMSLSSVSVLLSSLRLRKFS